MDDPIKAARLNRKLLMDRAKDRAKIAREMTRLSSYSPREHAPGEKSYVSPEEAIRALGLMENHRKIATDLVYRMVEGMPVIQAAKEARDAGIERLAVREMIRRTHRIIDEYRNLDRPVLSPRNNGPIRKAFNPLDLVKADKPPSGFVPMPKSKKGGYRYPAYPAPAQRYWYPGQGETHEPHEDDHTGVHEEHKDTLKQQLAEAEQKGSPSKEVHDKFMEVEAKAREEGLRLNGHPTGKHTTEHVDQLSRRLEQAIERRRDAAEAAAEANEEGLPPTGEDFEGSTELDDNSELSSDLGAPEPEPAPTPKPKKPKAKPKAKPKKLRDGAGCKQPDEVNGWIAGRLLCVTKTHRGKPWGRCEYRVRCESNGSYTLEVFNGNRADVKAGDNWPTVSVMFKALLGLPADAKRHRMTIKRFFNL